MNDFPKVLILKHFTGLSDHTIGIELPLIAITRGATIIEKHLTLDKSDTTIRDHALSLSPKEFKDLVDLGNSIYKMSKYLD